MMAQFPKHGYRTRSLLNQKRKNGNSSDSRIESNKSISLDSSSDYSDWLSQSQYDVYLSPPKKLKVTHTSTDKRKKCKKKLPIGPISINENNSDWLREVIPWNLPYFPQIGDDVVYFRQGHQKFLEAFRDRYNYVTVSSGKPWIKLKMKDHEFCKIIGIKYKIGPPQVCLKLAITDEEGQLTGECFAVKYHYMPGVHDFLILKQTFYRASKINWMIGMKFRCIRNKVWHLGKIQSIESLDTNFPESHFMCYRVRLDNGDLDVLSPWNLEPIDESNRPQITGGTVPVLQREIRKSLYYPQQGEWPMGDRGTACRKIMSYLNQVMRLPIAEPFINPVDLDTHSSYAHLLEYPVDLSTIKTRLENRFYRRIAALQFDIRYLAKNAEKLNEPHSLIVKRATLITDLCLQIIKDIDKTLDVNLLYQQMSSSCISSNVNMMGTEMNYLYLHEDDNMGENYVSSSSNSSANHMKENDRTSTGRQKSTLLLPRKNAKSPEKNINPDWKLECKALLKTLWNNEDSVPFREPVPLTNEEYYKCIAIPMCLQSVNDELEVGNFKNPKEFEKNMKLIFSNSRKFDVNRNSKIYQQTTKISNIFEKLMEPIINRWTLTKRKYSNKRIDKTKILKKTVNFSTKSAKLPSIGALSDDDYMQIEDVMTSSDEVTDDYEDPTWEMDSEITEESEEYSQVLDKLSQISTGESSTIQVQDSKRNKTFDKFRTEFRIRNGEIANNDPNCTQISLENYADTSDSWNTSSREEACNRTFFEDERKAQDFVNKHV